MPVESDGPIGFQQNKDSDYSGQINNGMNGIGMKVSTRIEEGMFVDGQLTGFGRIIYEDLSYYSGSLKNGNKDGQGTLTLANNNKITEFWKGDGVNCENKFSPKEKSQVPQIATLTYSTSTTPVDLKVALPDFFTNQDPSNCQPDICTINAADCSSQYQGNIIINKEFQLSAMTNVGDGQDETFCVVCTEGGNSLFLGEIKFTQTKCDAETQSPCPPPSAQNYRKNFNDMIATTPDFKDISQTLVETWTNEGIFDFQEHMNDGDYQFSETTEIVNVSTDFGNYVGQDYAVGGLGRWTTVDTIVEGQFNNSLPNGYGRIINSNGDIYYGDLLNGTRNGQGEEVFSNGTILGGFWIKDKFVENPLWYEVLNVFHSTPEPVSSFALKTWKSLKPFAVENFILQNKIVVADKTTGAVT